MEESLSHDPVFTNIEGNEGKSASTLAFRVSQLYRLTGDSLNHKDLVWL